MSMYAMMHGQNAAADWLLGMLDLTKEDVGRFRDAWVNKNENGYEIAVYTRNGGNNREDYMPDFSGHPLFLRDQDDDFDNTYATIFFKAPEDTAALLEGLVENRDPDKAWAESLAALKSGRKPEVVKAMAPLMEKIAEALEGK